MTSFGKFSFFISLLICCFPAFSVQWPEINLLSLSDSELPIPVQVTIKNDPVYKTTKTYQAYPLDELLAKLKRPKHISPNQLLVIFTAQDGYQSFMQYSDAVTESGFIAFKDINAPGKKKWAAFKFGTEMISPEPFYLVWPKSELDKWQFPWPFQLVAISIKPATDFFGAATPKTSDPEIQQGFNLFSRYCIRCHTVNNIGGKIGPKIVVSNQRQAFLLDFILDAPAYVKETKMPSFKKQLDQQKASAIIDYLKYINTK